MATTLLAERRDSLDGTADSLAQFEAEETKAGKHQGTLVFPKPHSSLVAELGQIS